MKLRAKKPNTVAIPQQANTNFNFIGRQRDNIDRNRQNKKAIENKTQKRTASVCFCARI